MPSARSLKPRDARRADLMEHNREGDIWERYPELLGRMLSHLKDEERCGTIPLVCRAWLRVHKEYPPHRTTLVLYCEKSGVVKPMVTWLLSIAGSLEKLKVYLSYRKRPQGLLSQLLCMAASTAPNLTHVYIEEIKAYQSPLQSLTFLSRIKRLDLIHLAFPMRQLDTVGLRGLTGLRSLEILNLEEVRFKNATPSLANLLWTSLASLPALASLGFNTSGFEEEGGPFPLFVLNSLSLLTQISALRVRLWDGPLEVGADLAPIFNPLTQLTALAFEVTNETESIYTPCLGLPLLKELKLGVMRANDQHVRHDGGLLAASHHLTSLTIRGGKSSTVAERISMDTPALSCLRILELADGGLDTFPYEAATRLKQLVVLSLRRNKFARLPPAVAMIPTLQELDLSGNWLMQLGESDVTTLAALSKLTHLNLEKGWSVLSGQHVSIMWTAASMQAALLIGKMLPQLNIQLYTI